MLLLSSVSGIHASDQTKGAIVIVTVTLNDSNNPP
jgi:hypothetical protein